MHSSVLGDTVEKLLDEVSYALAYRAFDAENTISSVRAILKGSPAVLNQSNLFNRVYEVQENTCLSYRLTHGQI